jgi:hypothetical protein
MTLPPPAPQRQLKHHRQMDVQVFVREDGLWEVDATLVDTKTRTIQTVQGPRPPGEPLHDMLLRLVIDRQLNVVAAGAQTRAMPYEGTCGEHGDAYGRLVGLNLGRGFRQGLKERVGGVLGCTHISELAQVLPTAVIQGFAGEVIDTRGDDGQQPFQIDRCHALRSDGEAVRQFYPRWYRPAHPSLSETARTAE